MPCKFIYFSVILFILAGFRGLSQNPVSRNYTADDGLASNEVYDIFEDSLGYLWFATDHGISRFDGYGFKNYSTNEGLSHNTIFGFFEDHRHRLWMRAFNSTLCYMEQGKILPYVHNDSLQAFLNQSFIQTFAIDSVGDLWFMSIRNPHGLYHQDHQTGRIRKIPMPKGYNAFIRELGHNAYIAGVDFSDSAKTVGPEVIYHDHSWVFRAAIGQALSNRKLVRVAKKGKGQYLFSFEESLTEINGTAALKKHLPGPHAPTVTSIYADRKKNFWFTAKGLYRYGADTLLRYFNRPDINCARQDRQGNFWIATYTRGIFLIPNMSVSVLEQEEDALAHLILQYKDQLLVTTQGKRQLSIFPLGYPEQPLFGNCFIVHHGKWVIHDLHLNEARKELFLGGVMHSSTDVMQNHILGSERSFSDSFAFTRSAFSFGKHVYFAGNYNWGIRDHQGKRIYVSQQDGFSKFCVSICMDSAHQVWIGTAEGLFRFRNGHTEAFHPQESMFRQIVPAIRCMADGVVAVSTRGSGIIFIDKGTVYSLRQADGLSTDLCGRLTADGNVLWVCTNQGLNKITVKRKHHQLTFEVMRLQTEHGLPSNLIYDATRYKDLLIFSTGKGLGWFKVHELSLNPYTPPVYIDAVYANKRLIGRDPELSYKETNLSFAFTGLLYNASGKIRYRYKLDGYEKDWNYTTERSVRYFNLPAGHYAFVVAAMNENGVWNETPATYPFHIPLHFTRTWWFLSLMILAGTAILCLIAGYYLKQRRIRERMNTAMLMAELKTLRSQMKPHFVFNSLSSIQHFILNSDQESAHLYLSRFSGLMRSILENTAKDSISLALELEMLERYLSLEKLRFGKEFAYRIILHDGLDPELADIPPMLIQPYIENAIWHGLLPKKGEARLLIRFYTEGNAVLVCEVEDNGIGRKAAAERQRSGHRSTGMKNIEERIGILNHMQHKQIHVSVTDLYDTNGTAAGTKVTLRFSNTLIPPL